MKNTNCQSCDKCGTKALWFSTLNNIILVFLKGGVAVWTGSRALLAEAIESGANIFIVLLAGWGMKYGAKPSDKKHHYGYGKIEFIVGAIVGIILVVVSAGVVADAVRALFYDDELHPPRILAFWVALLSAYSNFMVSNFTMCPAKELNSPALKSVAISNRSDAYTCVVVVLCILGSQFGLPQLDPIAACFIGLVIFKMGIELVIENVRGLMDASANPEIIEKIREITISVQEVKGISYLKTRMAGQKIFVEMQIFVHGKKTMEEANQIIHEVVSDLMRRINSINNVHVSLKAV